MRVLAVLCLSVAALASAGGSEEWDIYKKWTAMKAQESCWGEENMKLYTVNLKQAIAKCSQLDAPELSLPPFRSPYRFLNTLLTSAGEMEKRQVDLAVRLLDLLREEADDEDDFTGATTYIRKKIFTSGPFSLNTNEDSVLGLVKRLALKKTQERMPSAAYDALASRYGGGGSEEDLIKRLALKTGPSVYEALASRYGGGETQASRYGGETQASRYAGETQASRYGGDEEELVERLVEEKVKESMMEYKLKQSLESMGGQQLQQQTNRQRLAALMDTRRHRRQAPADQTKPAPAVPGLTTTLPESLDLGDRLAEKLKAQQERLTAKVGNFTCVLRETHVLNERNELDLELQKRGLEQYSLPGDGWFKKRLLDTYETCNKVAASLPAEAVEAGEASLVPGLYRIKSFLRCCKESKLRLCMFQDVKIKLEKNFGPLDKILAQTHLTEDQLFPLVIMLLHGEEMEYF